MCIAGAGGRKRSVYIAGGRKRSVYSWSWREKEECV